MRTRDATLTLVFACWCLFVPVTHAAETPRPNILFIAVDDLNDWIGCLGGQLRGAAERNVVEWG